MNFDPRCLLSWWEPRLSRVAPTPKTIVVRTDPDLRGDELLHLLDGNRPAGLDAFLARLSAAVDAIREDHPNPDSGAAALIRTGWTPPGASTLRRAWRSSLPTTSEPGELLGRVRGIVSRFQGLPMALLRGLLLGEWAVREVLAVDPIVPLDANDGMPLVPEVRAHVRYGTLQLAFPRWTTEDIERGLTADQKANLAAGAVSLATLFVMAGSVSMGDLAGLTQTIGLVAREFSGDGPWNVDLMETRGGWKAVGMSPAPNDAQEPKR